MNPTQREERIHRIRMGLTGLAVVFLFVLLGTAISRWSDDPLAPSRNELVSDKEPNEPLAEIGAAPGAAAANATAEKEAAPSGRP